MYMAGDQIRYNGNKFSNDIKKNGAFKGEVITSIDGEPGVYVVEFGDDAYVMRDTCFTKWEPSQLEEKEPVEYNKKRLRRLDADEE